MKSGLSAIRCPVRNPNLARLTAENKRLRAACEQIISEGVIEDERSRNGLRCYWCGAGACRNIVGHLADCPVAIAEEALKMEVEP